MAKKHDNWANTINARLKAIEKNFNITNSDGSTKNVVLDVVKDRLKSVEGISFTKSGNVSSKIDESLSSKESIKTNAFSAVPTITDILDRTKELMEYDYKIEQKKSVVSIKDTKARKEAKEKVPKFSRSEKMEAAKKYYTVTDELDDILDWLYGHLGIERGSLSDINTKRENAAVSTLRESVEGKIVVNDMAHLGAYTNEELRTFVDDVKRYKEYIASRALSATPSENSDFKRNQDI